MERRPTSILTTLAVSVLALTLIAPWAFGQDPDTITEIRRQAEQGDADAQYNLGYRYATGIGVPQDRAEAARWLRLAADQGHIQAEDFLARMPPMGSQRATDNDAETALREAIPPATGQSPRSGNAEIPEAIRESAGQDPDAITELRRQAEQGDADAQYRLGLMYGTGWDVVKDVAEGVRWLRLAAEQGDATAQFNLWLMYYYGEGVVKDAAEAMRWLRLAAEQGNADAQDFLGRLYAEGRGVIKDDAEAVRWLRLAAEQGDPEGQLALGVMYSSGRGVIKDAAQAERWYRLAAEQGDAIAQANLGSLYADGEGVPENDAEAVKWFRLAADQGNVVSQSSSESCTPTVRVCRKTTPRP